MQRVESNVTRFERLGLEDGLSQGCVYAILQDREGFLWIATQDGLNKYDGYEFSIYRHDTTDPTSLSSNVIYGIVQDAAGDLWLGTDRGLEQLDQRSEVFTHYEPEETEQRSRDPFILRVVLEDSEGVLWMGASGQGLYRLDRRTRRLIVYSHDLEDPYSLGSDDVVALLEDTYGALWVGTRGDGLARLDRKTGELTAYRHSPEDPHSLSSDHLTAICEDSQGTLWIGTEDGGLNALDIRTRAAAFTHYRYGGSNPHSLSNDHVTTLLEDATGTLWVGTGHGLNQLDRGTSRFRRHYHKESDPASLSDSEILSLAEDAQGILWIGTRTGLSKHDRTTRALGHYKRDQESHGALSSDLITAFLEDSQGTLWIGTYDGGLNRSTTDDILSGFVHYDHCEGDPHSLGDMHALPAVDRPQSLGGNGVFALCEDSQRRLWIGTAAGLHRLVRGDDPDSPPTFVRYRHRQDEPTSLSHSNVWALAEDAKGNLWIGTYGGLNRLNLGGAAEGFVRYVHDERDPNSISHDFVRTIHVDSAGNVWIGTNSGLNRLADEDASTFVRYKHDEEDPHSLSHDRVNCIAEDARGTLWVGTWGGLNRFDPQSGRFTSYREADGLSNDVVYGALVDDQGCLWLSTNKGINRFDPATERFTHYDVHDGVQGNEFMQGAFYKDRLGRIYFGGPNGFNVFHPDEIRRNRYRPPVVLTRFLIANKPVPAGESGPLKEHISFATHIELGPEDYLFAFEFTALNYRQPHKNRFAYKLEGFDRDWIQADAQDRKAVYTNVPPGTYSFRVKAANDDGLWNEEGTSIQVTVSQQWWHIVFGSAFEAVVIHDQGTILQANQAAVELFGYEQAELIGESIRALTPPEWHAEVVRRVTTGDETPYESAGLRKDGSTFVAEVRARAIPYQGHEVRVTALRDITARREAEEQLRKLSRAVEQSDSTILVTDLEGTIEFVNPAFSRVTGYPAPEAVGQNPRILKSGQMPEEVYADLWQTITRGQVWEGELLNKRKDGTLYWESAIISPVRDSAGNTTHYVGIKQDITARKRAEQVLEQRMRHEQALAACSQTLLKPGDAQPLNRELLSRALAYLMEAVQASRAYVFRNFEDPEDGFCTGIVAEAVVPGLPGNLDNPFYQKIPWSRVPVQSRLALEAGQDYGGPTEELFVSAPELLGFLREQSILSVKFFPIHFGDAWWGYIGFDDCQRARTWDPAEITVLRTASQIVASALQRWQAEAVLQEAHDRLEERIQARTAELSEAVARLWREVAQRERAEAETQARLVVEHSLAAISSRLMQAPDLDQALAGVLAEIGALYGAERVFFVRLQSDGQAVDRIDEWCRSGIAPIFDKVESWNLSGVSRWLDELHGRRSFYGGDMSQASHPFQAGIWHLGEDASGTRCAAPVYARDEMIGLLGLQGLASVDGNLGQDHQVLEVVLGMLGSAYSREQVLATLDQRIAVRTRELSTFFDLTTLAIGARDLRDMLDPIPGRILELGSCDAICIHLLDEERTTLTLAAQGNLSPEMRRRLQAIALDGDLMRRLDHPGEPLVVTVQANMTPLPPPLRLEGFPSYLGVPLPGGWVSYYRSSPHGFSLDQSSLLLALAEQIGVSVENYRLRQRLETAITSEERKRLARDLHDAVTQSLYSLNLFARSGQDALQDGDTDRLTASLARLETNSLQALREMRLLLYELRPEVLEQEGLIRTIEQRFEAVERRAGINATVRYDRDGPGLPQALERELYYLVVEALNNTLKHAGAQKVTVWISLSATQLWLEIADDGCGFDPQQVSGGYGLDDMRERMERLGGQLEISSAPGTGTRIVARVDLVQA